MYTLHVCLNQTGKEKALRMSELEGWSQETQDCWLMFFPL